MTPKASKLIGRLRDLADYFEPNDMTAAKTCREAAAEIETPTLPSLYGYEAGLADSAAEVAHYRAALEIVEATADAALIGNMCPLPYANAFRGIRSRARAALSEPGKIG